MESISQGPSLIELALRADDPHGRPSRHKGRQGCWGGRQAGAWSQHRLLRLRVSPLRYRSAAVREPPPHPHHPSSSSTAMNLTSRVRGRCPDEPHKAGSAAPPAALRTGAAGAGRTWWLRLPQEADYRIRRMWSQKCDEAGDASGTIPRRHGDRLAHLVQTAGHLGIAALLPYHDSSP